MNKNYVSPAIAMSEATTKFSTMITISGHVDNPDDSDSKKRYGFEEEEISSSADNRGTIW